MKKGYSIQAAERFSKRCLYFMRCATGGCVCVQVHATGEAAYCNLPLQKHEQQTWQQAQRG